MKIVCDCGNTAKLSTIDPDTGLETENDYAEGQYAHIEGERNFRFWSAHDVVGLVCNKCDKKIWLFT